MAIVAASRIISVSPVTASLSIPTHFVATVIGQNDSASKMYVNGMGLRGLERVLGVADTTVLTWIEPVGEN